MRYYPVFLDLVDQTCIVLGDGQFAKEKAAGLREAGAVVRVIPTRDYRDGELAGARLVVDASEDPDVNRRSWKEAEEAGILINVVDRPARCRFIAPAIVRRDPLLIAISTSGESPFLASALRARIERWLGTEWGPFTAMVGGIRRELRERGVPIAEQTRAYRRLIASEVRDLLRAGLADEAAGRAAALAQPRPHPGRVALVGAGPGHPDLISVMGRELLVDADHVLADALISSETLALCGPHTKVESVGKRGGARSARQADITRRLIELARQGNLVVRLKGGDPFVFGRGGEELRDLAAAGVEVMVVPGISSAFAAPAAAGIPVTLRGVSSSVAITTAQGGVGLERIQELGAASDTLIVLMARSKLTEIAAAVAQVVGGERPAAVISNGTLVNQRTVSGRLDEIAQRADREAIETPATLVIGDVVLAAPALSALRSVAR